MRRLQLMGSLLVLVLLAGTIPGAPTPKHLFPSIPPLYFPTAPGTTWIYDEGQALEIQTITSVEDVEGGKRITVERGPADNRSPYGIIVVTPKSVVQEVFAGRKLDTPLVWVKTPPAGGDTWDWEFFGLNGKDTVLESENLDVPAGRFQSVRVDSEYGPGEKRIFKCSCWYAPGVGLVKIAGAGRDRVLKSFTLGKDG